MKKIVLVGGGGHCKVIIDIIKNMNQYEIVGVTDKNISNNVLDIPIIGDDSILENLYKKGVENAFICIGDLKIRNILYTKLIRIGYKLPILTHKNAIVSKWAHIDEGTCIMPGSLINAGTNIGKNCIINTGSVVEHDCIIDYNTHISPNVSIAGGVKIGSNTHVGIGSCIIQNIIIGNNVTIGAGAVVIDNLKDNSLAVGVPAKVIKIKK